MRGGAWRRCRVSSRVRPDALCRTRPDQYPGQSRRRSSCPCALYGFRIQQRLGPVPCGDLHTTTRPSCRRRSRSKRTTRVRPFETPEQYRSPRENVWPPLYVRTVYGCSCNTTVTWPLHRRRIKYADDSDDVPNRPPRETRTRDDTSPEIRINNRHIGTRSITATLFHDVK